jgi:hypothetical protein
VNLLPAMTEDDRAAVNGWHSWRWVETGDAEISRPTQRAIPTAAAD